MGERRRKYSESETDSESESESDPSSRSEDSGGGGGLRRKERGGGSRAERKEKEKRRRRSEKEKDRERRRRRDRDASRRSSRKEERRRRRKKRRRGYSSEEEESSEFRSDSGGVEVRPEVVVRDMLAEFPGVCDDLKQLLQMIDDGQAVDIKGISEKALISHLRKLFRSLNLKESNGVYLLPADGQPVMAVVGPLIEGHVGSGDTIPKPSEPDKGFQVEPSIMEGNTHVGPTEDPPIRRRIIGPAMPSAELLAAAAKLTEAQEELRDAELEDDTELFIGPAPPAVVAEAESANEAERFEEVTRIMGADADNPYDILGVNHKMSPENVKKRYWKLSLLVHPDKCSHPEAHQSFIKLNKAFKDVQDPDKRKALDDKIKEKEEREAFKIELKAMREAAQWRRSQGISMEGDEELLAVPQENVAPKRDDWMTTLPPERNPNTMTMQSRTFSKTSREGRGDTSAWTDTPLDRAQKAKMNYLEAYNEATALASNEEEKKKMKTEADLVEMYNKAKRSKSLVQKHREESSKRKSKQKQPAEKEDWEGNHPWKPWDREKDLTAGRQRVKLDSEQMSEGLSSRFSSGDFQRSFL
ncbi:hypothetical protein MLD38_000327 [Melastoma candidum]|uniref:Uncharacterized protein n=1 Tax=Melastoma candidum TaxID=119954 RepID=A0ACB9S9U4_9MYRT|nr:hypothetical protein MLD38_000327 [Melastoma candidum]